MNLLKIVFLIFLFLECLNVLMMYFAPGSKKGNGVGVFDAWEKSKKDPDIHAFVKYLVYWVAGTKLIFIGLLLVIAFTGTMTTQIWAGGVMVVSIASYYWKLHPLIKDMDQKGNISPKGYGRSLGIMIGSFISVYVIALVISII